MELLLNPFSVVQATTSHRVQLLSLAADDSVTQNNHPTPVRTQLNSTLSSLELEFDTFIYYSAHTPTTSNMSHMSLHSNLAHPHISTI